MSQEPFQGQTRWRSAISTLVVAALCLVPVALAVAAVTTAGPGSAIGVLALLSAAVWIALASVMTRIALPIRASIQVDELGIRVEGRRRLVLPWTAIRAVGIRRQKGRQYALLLPDSATQLPEKLPPHIHLRPVHRVLILDLDGWQHPGDLTAALQAYAGDRWEDRRLLPPR